MKIGHSILFVPLVPSIGFWAGKRQERRMEALEKTASFHDVPETKGVRVLASKCLKDLSHSNIKS
jgi:hypothetical protein